MEPFERVCLGAVAGRLVSDHVRVGGEQKSMPAEGTCMQMRVWSWTVLAGSAQGGSVIRPVLLASVEVWAPGGESRVGSAPDRILIFHGTCEEVSC